MDLSSLFSSTNERSNIVKRNVIFSALVRGINIFISLILVPMTINYVNSDLYGIWLSLSSIVTWFGFFDIGFGLGLRNRLTTALALHKYKYGKILVSTTYVSLAIIFFVVGVLTCIGCTFVDWAYLLNISSDYNTVVTISFQIVIITFCLRMVLQLVSNVCQAYQMTALTSAIELIGNLLSLVAMFLLTKTIAPSLIWLSAVFCFSPLLAYLGANVILFSKKFRKVSPSFSYARRFVLRDITSLGLKFFIIQIVGVILYQMTNIIISHYCGPGQVTVYNIAYKYLNVALMALTIIQSPIWSSFTDAYASKDFQWMRSIYQKLFWLVILTEMGLVLLILVSPIVYSLWVGDSVSVPFHITLLLGIYIGLLLINNLNATIVNGIGKVKLQTITACAQAVVYVPLVYMFGREFQLEGILVSLIVVTIIPTFFLSKQVNCLLKQNAKGIYNI